jgi:hypothetical protein
VPLATDDFVPLGVDVLAADVKAAYVFGVLVRAYDIALDTQPYAGLAADVGARDTYGGDQDIRARRRLPDPPSGRARAQAAPARGRAAPFDGGGPGLCA